MFEKSRVNHFHFSLLAWLKRITFLFNEIANYLRYKECGVYSSFARSMDWARVKTIGKRLSGTPLLQQICTHVFHIFSNVVFPKCATFSGEKHIEKKTLFYLYTYL